MSSFSPTSESKRIGGGKVLPRCVPRRRSGHPVISVERILTTYMVQKYIPRRKWYRNNTRRKTKSKTEFTHEPRPNRKHTPHGWPEDAQDASRVAAAGRSDGRPPPPDCHRVLIRNHSGRSATCGNDTTSATVLEGEGRGRRRGRRRVAASPWASPVAPRPAGRGARSPCRSPCVGRPPSHTRAAVRAV